METNIPGITEDMELGWAIVTIEPEEGDGYEPVGVASTLNEAREIASGDMKRRLRKLNGDEDPGLCPYEYKVWRQHGDGHYTLAATLPATEVA